VISRAEQVDLTVYGEAEPDPTPYHERKQAPPYLCRQHRDTQWMHILSDGRVTLCCMDYRHEEILGDVREASLEDIWNGEAFEQARARIRGDATAGPNFLCDRCEYHVSRSVHEQSALEAAS